MICNALCRSKLVYCTTSALLYSVHLSVRLFGMPSGHASNTEVKGGGRYDTYISSHQLCGSTQYTGLACNHTRPLNANTGPFVVIQGQQAMIYHQKILIQIQCVLKSKSELLRSDRTYNSSIIAT